VKKIPVAWSIKGNIAEPIFFHVEYEFKDFLKSLYYFLMFVNMIIGLIKVLEVLL